MAYRLVEILKLLSKRSIRKKKQTKVKKTENKPNKHVIMFYVRSVFV